MYFCKFHGPKTAIATIDCFVEKLPESSSWTSVTKPAEIGVRNLLLNSETNMQPDPLVSLENEARKLDRAWDRAVRRRDSAAAWRIGERLRAISLAQEATKPTTAAGAAVVLGDAWAILSQKEELSLRDHYIICGSSPVGKVRLAVSNHGSTSLPRNRRRPWASAVATAGGSALMLELASAIE